MTREDLQRAMGPIIPVVDIYDRYRQSVEQRDILRDVVRKFVIASRNLLRAEHCQYCGDVGWYADGETVPNGYGEPEVEQVQRQCEWCYTNKNSVFNRQTELHDLVALFDETEEK